MHTWDFVIDPAHLTPRKKELFPKLSDYSWTLLTTFIKSLSSLWKYSQWKNCCSNIHIWLRGHAIFKLHINTLVRGDFVSGLLPFLLFSIKIQTSSSSGLPFPSTLLFISLSSTKAQLSILIAFCVTDYPRKKHYATEPSGFLSVPP